MKIGVFDSGFGGLDVLKEIIKELPQYSYIYLGDTARAPYGSRSQEEIYQFTKQAVDFLKKECSLIILACNTASSEALRRIQQEEDVKVLGVIIPAAEKAVDLTKNNNIGVIATQGTVASKAFERELKKLKDVQVFQQACPLLVPIVESGEQDTKIAEQALRQYLDPLLDKNIDTLILGCTHYGLLENKVRDIVGDINIVSEGEVIAEKLRDYLNKHKEIELEKDSSIRFLTTDITDRFQELGSRFFGEPIIPERINLLTFI